MNKIMAKSPWPSEIWNRKPKNEAQIAAHRLKHSTDERRRRGEMKDLFEKLQLVLGWPAQPQVAKRILLNRASKEIQRLKDKEEKLTSEKKLLMSKQNALIHCISSLSGKSQQVILKKLEYISAKQKVIEMQKNQQQCQEESVEIENDSFIMPRIVNVMTLAAEGNAFRNLEVDKCLRVILDADSQAPGRSLQVVSQEVTHEQPDEKAELSCGKERQSPRTRQKDHFPQIVNDSTSEDSFAAKLCFEELVGSQAGEKQIDCDRQKAKDSLSQKLQQKDSGIEKDLQNGASAIQEAVLDASDLLDIEENDDTDETLPSLLNEIAFLNRQLNDDSSDIAELPNSLSSGFSLGDVENRREPSAAHGPSFQFKDLFLVQDSNGSITPLLLHLEGDNVAHGDKKLRDPFFERGVLKFMPDHEVKDSSPDCAVIISDNGPKHIAHLVNTANVSPSILQVRTNLEPDNMDAIWKPMPKLAPFGLKGTNFQLDSGGQNSKVMPLLWHVGTKASSIELKVSQTGL